MDENSPKPLETPFAHVLAVRALIDWLQREGGNQKIPLVLEILAKRTESNLTAGHMPPALDADTLRTLFFSEHGGVSPNTPAGSWLPRHQLMNWWRRRRVQIEQACRASCPEWTPMLAFSEGGGRSNPTTYRLGFAPVPAFEADDRSTNEGQSGVDRPVIEYALEPAKPALWLRLLIGSNRFRMRSWRGYVLLGIIVATSLLLVLMWCALFLAMRMPRPVTTADIVSLLMAAFLSFAFWKLLRPLIRVGIDRVTVASDPFLALSQMHAQFRMSRDASSKLAGGWFSVVRHWAYCPICSGEVEILSGGEAFPGRLVGRCSDSPLEHVYSFDPVSLSGRALLNQNVSSDQSVSAG